MKLWLQIFLATYTEVVLQPVGYHSTELKLKYKSDQSLQLNIGSFVELHGSEITKFCSVVSVKKS